MKRILLPVNQNNPVIREYCNAVKKGMVIFNEKKDELKRLLELRMKLIKYLK